MSGYARIHRTLLGHPAFRNDAEAMAFAWLVVRAQWKDTRVRYKDRRIDLRRGQLAVSVRDFAAAMDRDKAWVERLLKRLRGETMIETVSDTGISIITICNYGDYQAERDTDETRRETPSETGARQARDTEQVREEVKKEPKGSERENARAIFGCPPGVDQQHWRDFLANRKRRKMANTVTAYEGQLRELERLSDDEWPPGRLVELAAGKGWGSINDPRTTGYRNGTHQPNLGQNGSGKRASPALALLRQAESEERAERDQAFGGGTWPPLQAIGAS